MTALQTSQVDIEFLYLDIETCRRCKGTDANLTAAMEMAQTLLDATDSVVTVRKILVDSEEKATALGFRASPTIRVNGKDIATELRESRCGDCTEVCGCGEDIACRVWRYKGEDYEVAPVPVLLNAIMSAVYSSMPTEANPIPPPVQLPDNLHKFFAAARTSAEACCTSDEASVCCAPEEKSACCGSSAEEPATCGCK